MEQPQNCKGRNTDAPSMIRLTTHLIYTKNAVCGVCVYIWGIYDEYRNLTAPAYVDYMPVASRKALNAVVIYLKQS